MNCPQCNEALPQTGLACSKCGADVSWYIRKSDGSQYGPYDLATIELCIREARLGPGDTVRIGAGDYESAQHLLGERFPKAPPPATYVPVSYPAAQARPPGEGAGKACGIVALVFVIIIGGIVAAMIPVTRQARKQASSASCMANLKQIDLGLLMYCQDYDKRFPSGGNWQAQIYPYVKNNQIFICPGYPKETGYQYNAKLAGVALDNLPQPAQTLSLWDAGAPVPGFPPLPGATTGRHNSGDNFGFADGHVKPLASSAPKTTDPGVVPPKKPAAAKPTH